MSSPDEKSSPNFVAVPVVNPERTMETALESLRSVIQYDLAVVLSIEERAWLRVRKAAGPLAHGDLNGRRFELARFPELERTLRDGHARVFDTGASYVDLYREVLDLPEGHSCLAAPLIFDDEPIGLLTLDNRRCDMFTPDVVVFITAIARLVSLALGQADSVTLLQARNARLQEERDRLLGGAADALHALAGSSAPWMRVLDEIRLVAGTDTAVLLLGETGTGKDEAAKAIHRLSSRSAAPFVAVNCSALAPSLAESEFFGHEKGSFTGAVSLRKGRFELANGGTLFLDEIADLPLEVQPKLLRALQEGSFERVGGESPVSVDVRVVAATNLDLRLAVAEGRFREDLFYRLNVFPIRLPPLRERGADSLMIAERFLSELRAREGFSALCFSAPALDLISSLPWKGNARELRNAVERAAILSRGGEIDAAHFIEHGLGGNCEDLPGAPDPRVAADPGNSRKFSPLEVTIRERLAAALSLADGRIRGPGGAAELLGLKPTTLQSKLKRYGLRP